MISFHILQRCFRYLALAAWIFASANAMAEVSMSECEQLKAPPSAAYDIVYGGFPTTKHFRTPLRVPSHGSCLLWFSLKLPGIVAIDLRGRSATRISVVLWDASTRPARPFLGTTTRDRSGYHLRYDLRGTRYALQLNQAAARGGASRGATEDIEFSVKAHFEAPPLQLHEGNATTLSLARGSPNKTRQFVVHQRSLVKFSLDRTPPRERLDGWPFPLVYTDEGVLVEPSEKSRRSQTWYYPPYILPPGTYFIQAPSLLPESLHKREDDAVKLSDIRLTVETVQPYRTPQSMAALTAWLRQSGLHNLMEFYELADLRDTRRNLPGATFRLQGYATILATRRTALMRCRSAPQECPKKYDHLTDAPDLENPRDPLNDAVRWPSGTQDDLRPALVVHLTMLQDRDTVAATEKAFTAAHGVSLWSRLFQKISHLEGISARKIVVLAPVFCGGIVHYMDSDGDIASEGRACAFASASAPIPVPAEMNAAASAAAPNADLDLALSAPPFLAQFFGNPSATLDVLSAEHDFFEVIIRGLRGRVVRGGADWEKLQLTLTLTRSEPRILRVSLDGQMASGIGDYPPDSQFTRDMDVGHKGEITDFSKNLVTAMATYLSQRRVFTPSR